jgi:hypothetical protein
MILLSSRGRSIMLPGLICGISHIRKLDPTIAAAMAAVMAMPFLLAKPA